MDVEAGVLCGCVFFFLSFFFLFSSSFSGLLAPPLARKLSEYNLSRKLLVRVSGIIPVM